jgi:hypothetical protein
MTEISEPKNPAQHERWSPEEMQKLKKLLLMFGLDRWSKMRSVAKKICKPLATRSDDEMRCYSNFFLLSLAGCLQDNSSLLDIVLGLIDTREGDVRLDCSANDFADNFITLAEKWAKRINLIKSLTHLVRAYRAAQSKFNAIPYQV